MRIILASASPRRRELIKKIPSLEVEIIPSDADEDIIKTNKENYVKTLAEIKAKAVFNKHGGNVVGADTVVVINDEILGKPKDKEDAFRMLSELSGQTHMVVTSLCGINTKTNRAALLSTTSYVRFKELDVELIRYYVDEFNPLDKAGSYGIQELPEGILDKYEGSFENIVGLAPEAVTAVLEQLGYINK